ncbi:hypothetical protein GTQ99_13595 [Kineococcus sp. T13]|uniref:hypothetical protein n=1 Tax=Kineococcus vitellinus TaxID=2696565 RepID=UPI001412B383|nr:hypothetical protein [Kineococcus vitellinus]NAZ76439.1 hypothetical protein [Kineococcus vitellinus]
MRPTVRRTLGAAAAAVALGAGTVAAAAAPAAAAPADRLSSRVVAVGDGLVVRSTVPASADLSYVESVISGRLDAACFRDGEVVRGTAVRFGQVLTGSLDGVPWYNSGEFVDTVVEASATTSTVDASVVFKNVLRDRAGDLQQVRCPAGTVAGFHRYQVQGVRSVRYTFAGEATATTSARQRLAYSFPAPTA